MTIRSVGLDRKDRFEMGRQLDRLSLSRFAFLGRGVTSECLKAIGELPVESERLIILVITGRRTAVLTRWIL